jgi:broad specificity phosphatase PhoE
MQLLIARHAETVWNVEHRIQGWTDSKLTVTGTQQAKALAERLRYKRLAAIYCSDSGRAMATAECVAIWHGMDVTPLQELRETSWGLWEGMTAEDIAVKYPDAWEKFRARDNVSAAEAVETDSVTHVPGGETVTQASDRLHRGLDIILSKYSDSNDPVLLVGHGGSVRFILTRAIGISPAHARRFHIDNASLSEIHIGKDEPAVIHSLNDISHLVNQPNDKLFNRG